MTGEPRYLSRAIPEGQPWQGALSVCRRLRRDGFEAWLVGGCIRDLLLQREVVDVDIATSATPEQVEACFSKTVSVGRAFGVIIVLEEGHRFEVATFRADGIYIDGRRPEGVIFTDAAGDVARRDFTINALLMDPEKGTIIDHVGGCQDLESRCLRVVGDPWSRLREDRLRVLRGIRFAAGLGLSWDPTSWAAVCQTDLQGLSRERVVQEIDKGLGSSNPGGWLRMLEASGHLPEVFPLTTAEPGATVLDHLEGGPDARIVAALGVVDGSSWWETLPLSRDRQRRLAWLQEGTKRLLTASVADRRRWLRHPDGADLAALVGEQAQQWLAMEPATLPPLLTPKDLLALGRRPGPRLGQLLREVEDAQLEGRLATTAEALAWVAAQP